MKRCVGCGYCCIKVVCGLGQMFYVTPPDGKCPGLVWDEEKKRYWCKLVLDTEATGDRSISSELSIGEGCCCGLNTWRRDVRRRDEVRSQSRQGHG